MVVNIKREYIYYFLSISCVLESNFCFMKMSQRCLILQSLFVPETKDEKHAPAGKHNYHTASLDVAV